MELEEIQMLSDELLLNKLLLVGNKHLADASILDGDEIFHTFEDLKREVLFRMYHGTRGKPTYFPNEDGDLPEK